MKSYLSKRERQAIYDMKNDNHIRIANKNPVFNTQIYYSKVWKEYIILLDSGEIICGEKFKTANQVYDWVLRNIDDSGTDENLCFMYSTDWDTINKGRLFYELDPINWDNNSLKFLLYMLI